MKSFLIALLVFAASHLSAQTNAVKLTPMQVYKTYADFAAQKPAEGIDVTDDGEAPGKKHVLVVNDRGTTKSFTVKEIPYYAYTDADGLLIRPYDGKSYFALVLGKLSYYYCTCEGDLMMSEGNLVIQYVNNGPGKSFYQYTSDGPEGKIEYSGKTIKQLLADEPELQAAYKKEVPKRGFPGFTESGERETGLKYLKLLNESKN